ncbi:MAG: sigma-54-dependent Fis family transcriptional regulator [Desulfuromonadales bacterium]|nr:sigma-54-dependent Fis family transcriptional regulator [Desulfuromonadales bacterium]
MIADADPGATKVLAAILGDEGFAVHTATCCASASRLLQVEEIDTIISDLQLPGGLPLFRDDSRAGVEIPLILLSSAPAGDSISWALDRGAWCYFRKPPDYPLLKRIIARAVSSCRLARQLQAIRQRLRWMELQRQSDVDPVQPTIFGKALAQVRDCCGNLLIEGEAGVGCRRLAFALHLWRTEGKQAFHLADCVNGELVFQERRMEDVISAELFPFGARGGTLYLRGVGNLRLAGQRRLGEWLHRLSADGPGASRVIAASGRDLTREVAEGRFSNELLQMLSEHRVELPPLRRRRWEIPWLAWRFLGQLSPPGGDPPILQADAIQALVDYSWPGNDRQLRQVLTQAMARAGGPIGRSALPQEVVLPGSPGVSGQTLRQMESLIIQETLQKSGGNKSHAAKVLGLSRKTLYKRLKESSPSSTSAAVG